MRLVATLTTIGFLSLACAAEGEEGEGFLGLGGDDEDGGDGDEQGDGDDTEEEEPAKFDGGGWLIDACVDDIESTGNGKGDVAEDFALKDQFGETVNLHAFCDHVVYVVFSAEWCGNCQAEAATLEDLYDEHHEDGLMVIEVMIEDQRQDPPDRDVLERWADTYGLSIPVLADPNGTTMWSFAGSGTVTLPYTVVLDRGAVVHKLETATGRDAIGLL